MGLDDNPDFFCYLPSDHVERPAQLTLDEIIGAAEKTR
jgi:hypothetical protein